jgi:alkaline phosphatase
MTACAHPGAPAPPKPPRPHSIILLIGDGMGAAHVTRARALRGKDFQIGRMRTTGLIMTASANDEVTDSSAAATAYATGVRTNNGYLGVDRHGKKQRTVLEAARARGMATGLVTTAIFGDATPAAFSAHHLDRKDRVAVAKQVVTCGADLLISGGLDTLMVPLEELAPIGGYTIAPTLEAVRQARGRVLAIWRSSPLDADFADAPLPAIASAALDRLSSDPDGFFLLIEHEGTDSASHMHDGKALDAALRSFDETVGIALDYAGTHPGVLVLVAGDHETGGLQLLSDGGIAWGTEVHTGEAVPLFADGVGAAGFGGVHENASIGQALLRLVDDQHTQLRDGRQ